MLNREEENADFWLAPETKPKMLQIIHREMIGNVAEAVISKPESGCAYMFQNALWEELKLMYNILSRDTESLAFILQRMCPYIEARG